MNKIKCFESSLLGDKYYAYTHPTGLQILVFPKRMSTSYALFGVKYGSINNTFTLKDGTTVTVPDGIAHFLEHKLFSNEDGSDSFERFSEYGADANAYTSFNRTAYLFSCTDNFDLSLGELIDFVTHPHFTPESVASEIGIIAEEIRMYDDSPSDRCFYGMLEGMYREHSIRRNICGSEASIRQITHRTLYDCYNAFYRPDNMVLTVCGDLDAQHVIDVVCEHLPEHFSGSAALRTNDNDKEAPTVFREYVEIKMPVSKPIFNIGFKDTDIPTDPVERQRKDAVMAILNEMLFSRSGEFYSSLFEQDLISPAMSYGYTISETFAYNSIAGEANDPKLILEMTRAHIEKVRASGLDPSEFERAKKVMYSEFIRLFDSTENIANTVFSFFSEDAELFEYADILAKVTFEDVVLCFDKFFRDGTICLSVVAPI